MIHEGIGGYFELELPDRGGFLHDDGVLLNSGRNALEYVLRSLPDVRHLWIPYYSCDVILEPIKKLDIAFTFYRINDRLEIRDTIDLPVGSYLLYTNYFGIKDQYVQQLAGKFGIRLIVDNAQAWYTDPIPGISTIYSPRKFVGVPDGGIAYCRFEIDLNQFEQDYSYDRCLHLLKRIDLGPSAGYQDFRESSNSLVGQPIRRMSRLTRRMLKSIDYDAVKQKRWEGFLKLDERLRMKNILTWVRECSFMCPMVYPFLTDSPVRDRMIENNIFVATYWTTVLNRVKKDWLERVLVDNLFPLPCDQRYGTGEMERIIGIIEDALY